MTTVPSAPLIPVLKRRLRALTYLAGTTGVAVLLAALALWQRAATGVPDFKPVRMFADLEAKREQVATIQIETKKASFNVSRTADGHWVLPDRENYPADVNAVRKVVLGLAKLDLVEEKTGRADLQEKLGLGLPKSGGSGTLVTLKDGKGEVLASVIVGQGVEGESAGGRKAAYVRRPNEPQTYVARGDFEVKVDEAKWLDKTFIEIAPERMQSATLHPFKGGPYSVTRADGKANFRVVEAIPRGRQLRTENEANSIGNALLGLAFDDVQPREKIDFSKAATASYTTFDGLTLAFNIVENNNEYWVTLSTTAKPVAAPPPKPGETKLQPNVPKESDETNATVAKWAYKIPRYKGAVLTAPLEDLLRPIGSGGGQ